MGDARTQPAPILVVEDDPSIRRVIEMILEDEMLPVESAADGAQALAWLQRYQPALVILDWDLPLVSGYGVMRGMHALYGGAVPILSITAADMPAAHARRLGAVAYLAKPFDIEALLDAVRAILGS